MPTTIGHAIAGVGVAWAADLVPGERRWRTAPPTASWYERAGGGPTLACAVLAALPDADLLFHIHRMYSHSIGAVIFVGIVAAAIAANANRPIARVALMCVAAYATHVLFDWMGVDRMTPAGIQALWPFTQAWYISGWDVFRQTERGRFLSLPSIAVNLHAVAQEAAILGPIVAAIWLVREKALARLTPQAPGRDHPAK